MWWLARHARDRIILSGYGETFARDWGAKVRDRIIENAPDLNLALSKDKLAADDWELSTGGGMVCTGVGGALTGRGADLFIIDDPIKNDQEASSQVYRDRMWDWFQASAFTRLQPNGVMIVVATRWHGDDLIGRILASDNTKKWTTISIPALAGPSDPLGRAEGAPLWPEHFTDDPDYEIRKKSISPYWWSALYQQSPSPEGGGIIQESWFQFYSADDHDRIVKEADQIIQSWDPALLDRTTSDYWAGIVLARKGADIYVLDLSRGHYNLAQATGIIRRWAMKYPKGLAKLIENTSMGPAIKQTLQHEVSGIIPIAAKGTKRSRIEAAIPALMANNVWLPQNKDGTKPQWVWDLISEACAYDKGTYDDQIDALAQGINFMTPGAWRDQRRALEDVPPPQLTPREQLIESFSKYTERVLAKATNRFNGPNRLSHRRW
jgi:predicted phage terminase large subunit-like protein